MLNPNFDHAISAIIITGGWSISSYRSVEILRETGNYWCSLPDLPDIRYNHTQSGLITCGSGGYNSDTETSCLTLTDGQWMTSYNTAEVNIPPGHHNMEWCSWEDLVAQLLLRSYMMMEVHHLPLSVHIIPPELMSTPRMDGSWSYLIL